MTRDVVARAAPDPLSIRASTRGGRLATKDNIAARIAELTQALSAAFVMAGDKLDQVIAERAADPKV